MSTRDLIDALASGDSIAIDSNFNSVMSQKISAALDSYRVEVAKSMFAQPQTEIETEEEQNTDADTEQA